MDKRILAAGLCLLVASAVLFGLSFSSTPTVMALDGYASRLLSGRLDVTVVVHEPAWTLDLRIFGTGESIVSQQIPVGTRITFLGTLLGKDNLPLPFWVPLNIMPEGTAPESGTQCWIGSARTDEEGTFGANYYLEVREDGWWSNYPGVGENGEGAYIHTKNGADNPGCQSWATTNPIGKRFLAYAAVNKDYYSPTKDFGVKAGVVSCAVQGEVTVTDGKTSGVVLPGDKIRIPPQTTWIFTATSSAESVATVTVGWTGPASGSKDLSKMSETRWSGAISLVSSGSAYGITVKVTCSSGTTKTMLSIADALVREGAIDIIHDPLQQLRDNLSLVGIVILVGGVLCVGYGFKKEPPS